MTSSDLLMTWFEHTSYGGYSDDIYGSYGTCDSAGYRLSPGWWWQTNMSSAAGWAQCNAARFVNRAGNYARSFWLPVGWFGEALNDNVGRIWVYHG